MDVDSPEASQALVPRRLNMNDKGTKVYDVPLLPYWLGFSTLNALGKSREAPKEPSFSLDNPIAKDMNPSEASECVTTISSYPYVVQKNGQTFDWMDHQGTIPTLRKFPMRWKLVSLTMPLTIKLPYVSK